MATTDTKATDPIATNPAGGDPFASLHHMSTTAGVGSHEYVAINTPAVAAAVAGAASAAAFLSQVLLVIPAFAVVCGVIGLVQIRGSNGTQKGSALGVLGILLAVLIAGTIGYQETAKSRAFEASKEEIGNLFSTLANYSAAGDYQAGYSLFGPAFKDRVKYPEFETFFKTVESYPNVGRVKELAWNQLLEAAEATDGTSNDVARAVVLVKFEKANNVVSATVTLVRRPDGNGGKGPWVIEAFSPFFDPKPAPKQGPPAAPGQGPTGPIAPPGGAGAPPSGGAGNPATPPGSGAPPVPGKP